ncbi:hypothetical protein CSB67_3980 [Enterobacter hormaechei]|nr:hypothetical protein CSB67_3980 [Enterobacter hormaechei]
MKHYNLCQQVIPAGIIGHSISNFMSNIERQPSMNPSAI